MPTGSLMLKLDKETKSINIRFLAVSVPPPLSVVIPSLFMEEDDGPLFMESG